MEAYLLEECVESCVAAHVCIFVGGLFLLGGKDVLGEGVPVLAARRRARSLHRWDVRRRGEDWEL